MRGARCCSQRRADNDADNNDNNNINNRTRIESQEQQAKDAEALSLSFELQVKQLQEENAKLESLVNQEEQKFAQLKFAQTATEAIVTDLRANLDKYSNRVKQGVLRGVCVSVCSVCSVCTSI